MNVKTMEGLAGAGTSISLVSTPMSVAKEAERKGDTEKMKRALSYAAGMTEQAEGYSKKTDEGMKLDAKEAKEQEKLRQEELIKARREEREKLEKQLQEGEGKTGDASFDSAEISEEGKHQVEAEKTSSSAPADSSQDVAYDKSGEAVEPVLESGENIDVVV
ncbi:MAG: hypothetical protein HFG78_07615 [Hungatella sp.]|jgi:hypothetical protein|nr:hypothetical protein [Hungatella sp.]MCI9501827.1 hypothetical protein [Hungatella sp.]MCI9636908.1 hypothetical protein [Hungatella sp.]